MPKGILMRDDMKGTESRDQDPEAAVSRLAVNIVRQSPSTETKFPSSGLDVHANLHGI